MIDEFIPNLPYTCKGIVFYTLNNKCIWSTISYLINKKGANKLINKVLSADRFILDECSSVADLYIYNKLLINFYLK